MEIVTIKVPVPVLLVGKWLRDAGFESFLVGGSVRDLMLKKELIVDWDFTTNATPDQIQSLLPNSFYDNSFGTVMVAAKHILNLAGLEDLVPEQVVKQLDVFDITTYRNEFGYSNKRHPDRVVWGQKLEADVKRRDFTINAMAMELNSLEIQPAMIDERGMVQSEVKLVDYHNGMDDLTAKLVRAVGNPGERFREDALRMMRAIRIGAEMSFGIEPDTLQAIREEASLIKQISGERVRNELMKILASKYPADGIILLHTSGLLKYVIPELTEGVGIPQGGRHRLDVWGHSVESLRECPSRDPVVRLATLLHDVGKSRTVKYEGPRGVTFFGHEVVGAYMSDQIAKRLRMSSKERQKLFTLVRWHMFVYDEKMTDAAIRRFIRRVGLENINDMMMLRIGDRKGGGSRATSWRLRELQHRIGENLYEPMGVGDLKIDGNVLMAQLKLKPGPIIGKLLNRLFEEVMEDRIKNEPDVLLTRSLVLLRELGNETK